MATVTISPRNPLIDEILHITIHGLKPGQNVTIKASTTEGNAAFSSFACYNADGNGFVRVSEQPAVSGTYTGNIIAYSPTALLTFNFNILFILRLLCQ